MRNAFIQELVALARRHPHIALIVGDLGYPSLNPLPTSFLIVLSTRVLPSRI